MATAHTPPPCCPLLVLHLSRRRVAAQGMATSRLLKGFIVAGVGVTAVIALIAGALVVWLTINDPFGGKPHPTDAEMLTQFAKVRPTLDELVVMIGQDRAFSAWRRTLPAPTRLRFRPSASPITANACKGLASRTAFLTTAMPSSLSSRRAASPSAAAARASYMPRTPIPMRRWSTAISMRRSKP